MPHSSQDSGANPPDDVVAGNGVSVILPVYNEKENLDPLLSEIERSLDGVEHEIVAVDDGSSDGSGEELEELTNNFPQLRVVRRPHAGQSAALAAGFEQAVHEHIVTMDADGQNDPEDIRRLLRMVVDSTESVAVVGVRQRRAVSRWKRFQARIANTARDLITGDRVTDTGCALRVAKKSDLLRLPRFRGMHRFMPTLLRREGVRVIEVPVNDRRRRFGSSKYGMWNRVFVGLVDALGVRWLTRRSL